MGMEGHGDSKEPMEKTELKGLGISVQAKNRKEWVSRKSN